MFAILFSKDVKSNGSANCEPNGDMKGKETCQQDLDTEVQTVAYMIIFGDALHNFIDGLSMGAAFANRILFGVSVSLAIFCEELPHELGKRNTMGNKMNNYIVRSYRDVIVISKFAITIYAIRRASKAQSIVMY